MNVIGSYFSYGIILITVTALPIQKFPEVISTRLVTRWELEFVSLNLGAKASQLPCPVKGTSPNLPYLYLVTRYEIPNRPMRNTRLSLIQPKLDCEKGLILLGKGESPSMVTISAISDQTCLSDAALRLNINIGAKDESTSSAFFHTTVYPEQTTIEWKEKFLLDDTGNSILRLKWRVSCQHHKRENHQRLKRQIPGNPANGDNTADNNSTTLNSLSENSDTPNVTSTASPPLSVVENSTEIGQNSSQIGQGADALGSVEPPDTGISETFGFTKASEPSKVVSNLLNQPGKSTKAVGSLDLGNSSSSSTPAQEANDLVSSSGPPVIPNTGNQSEDNLVKQNSTDISAPAAGDRETTDPPNKPSDVNTEDLGTSKPSTSPTTSKPTRLQRPGDREDPNTTTTTAPPPTTTTTTTTTAPTTTTTASITTTPTQSTPAIKTSTQPPTTLSTRRTRSGDQNTTTTKQTTPSIKSSSQSTTSKPKLRQRPGDRDDPNTTTTTAPTTTITTASPTTTTTQSTPSIKTSTQPPTTKSTRRTRPGDQNTTTTKQTTPSIKSSTQSTTSKPTLRQRPGDRDDPNTTKPTTTKQPNRPANGEDTTSQRKRFTLTSSPTITTTAAITRSTPKPTSTKKDVIFTAQQPTPTYPDTSNEPYIGKTGDTSSAGRVDKDPNVVSDDETDEATIWPIVMGLVVGIPTIIVISIAIMVVQKKHFGLPQRTLSSPGGYFERRPPQVPFVIVSKHDVSSTVI